MIINVQENTCFCIQVVGSAACDALVHNTHINLYSAMFIVVAWAKYHAAFEFRTLHL